MHKLPKAMFKISLIFLMVRYAIKAIINLQIRWKTIAAVRKNSN